MTTSHQPQDRYKAVWLIFFVLGLGTLLPWNFFITATQYFTSRLNTSQNISLVTNQSCESTEALADPSVSLPARSSLSAIFNNVMTLCAMLPLLIFTCLNSFLHQKVSQSLRILGSLLAILLVFLVTATLVKVQMDALSFFIITMIKIVLINSFGAILQASLFGLAGVLPANYTAPIMSGQGLAGFFTSVAMICAVASGSKLSESAFGYFITACAVVILAILCYLALPWMEFYRHYLQLNLAGPAEQETKLDLISEGEEPRGGREESGVPGPNSLPANRNQSIKAILKSPGQDSRWLPVLVACRVVFIPLLMLCNVKQHHYLPSLFKHDVWFITFMAAFAFSNGYLASLCMCFGPKKVKPAEAETAGNIMSFFLCLGLALGAVLSFLLRALV
uniref:equilibrative nucleoside transporter 1 isoform 2 n=1 Tax=Rattus norvegicus TaxID=10116 RepID=UPI0034D7066B